MKFLILYLFAFLLVFTLGFIIEWFQNPNGSRTRRVGEKSPRKMR